MHPLVEAVQTAHTPESLVERLRGAPGIVLLRSGHFDSPDARFSLVAARPFLTFRSKGSRCETAAGTGATYLQSGDPWRLLDDWMARFEVLDGPDLPFPLGGCFGFWGYDLRRFVEPRLSCRTADDLGLPDSHLGFYDSLVVFDHRLGKTWMVSTGLGPDGGRDCRRAGKAAEAWRVLLGTDPFPAEEVNVEGRIPPCEPVSMLSRTAFMGRVAEAQRRIRAGEIYQVNLSHRLSVPWLSGGWDMFRRLYSVSPAPFSAYLDCGDFQLASSSPESFLRMSGRHIETRPIKGTRPRSADANHDARLAFELQTSAKENAELVMITDLLRNDLGKVCEYGTVRTPDLCRLERFPQVQHLVSTVEGRLRKGMTHPSALAACFPGGSITGAPKIRAMEIIDELEPVARGPYTGALGYLGFNRESRLSIVIRTAVCRERTAWFHVGAGIVADSDPAAEYEETLAKAGGWLAAIQPDGVFSTPERAVS